MPAAATTYRWALDDLKSVPKNGRKVFTTFACGGGSSMGYKLAGFDVIAANDIDPVMARHYQANLHPKHYFLCPVIDIATMDLPDELIGIDLLDGSPPCSTFSMSGNREADWGKNKHFREGQTKQVLSDLFFDFLKVVDRVKPKMVVAENVKGMLNGAARGYVKLILSGLDRLGYRAQLFLVNAADCGVPQRRERVFFVAIQKDIDAPPLTLNPTHRWISAGEAIDGVKLFEPKRFSKNKDSLINTMWHKVLPGENYSAHVVRSTGKLSFFSHMKLSPAVPSPTLQSNSWGHMAYWDEPRYLDVEEWRLLGAFPSDYAFESPAIGGYMIGMSVPPLMTKAVADAIAAQWVPLLLP